MKPSSPAYLFYGAFLLLITGWLFVFKKAKHKFSFFLTLILLLVFTWFMVHFSFVQNALISKATAVLSQKLHTKVKIDHVDFHFFDKLDMKGLLVEDQQKDTLLYAGNATVNITDWFFLKDKPVIEYISLQDAKVDLHRTDSVWNYQFIADFFAGPKTTDKKGSFEIDLKTLKLHNIQFRQVDKWIGQDMIGSIKDMDLRADEFDMAKKRITISNLYLDEPQFLMSDYTGNVEQLHLPEKPPKPKDTTSAFRWNKSGWVMTVQNIHLQNGIFESDKETLDRGPYADRFDGLHLKFAKITGDLKNVLFKNDTISTDAKLSTRERSGFEVKNLQAHIKFTPEIMEFNNLDLVTNKSRLGNYYSMRYDDFNQDMGRFMHKVNLEGNFVNSEINTDDLAFFAPELISWKRIFKFSGNAKGTIDNLSAKKMLIKSGNTFLDGDIALKGLPDIDNTFIDFKANDLQTTFSDLVSIIPSLKDVHQPELSKLGNIRYKGNYTGFINDFVAFGTINTNLGTVTGDVNLKLLKNQPPIYLGKVSTIGFRLGEFFGNKDLGAISFNGKLKGSGFTLNNLNANFDGEVQSVDFAGYTYQHINIKGDFRKKLFNGKASIDDPNLKLENLTGSIDLNGKVPKFNFDAVLTKADLKKLKLSKDSFDLTGHFNFDFTGDNIDNFLGTAKIYTASLVHNGKPLSFDSLTLQSLLINDHKYLALHSNEMDASVTGNFKILDLPRAFQVFLSKYYPAYITKPKNAVSDQDFSFEIKTREADNYIQLLDSKLRGFDNSIVSGNLKLKSNELNIDAEVPQFSYDGKVFNNIRIHGKGSLDSLATTVDVDDVAITDSLHLPITNLVFTSFNDTSNISIKTSASQTVSDASINARLITLSDGVKVHFFPSSFIINNNKWQLEKDGEIVLSKSQVSASEVKFIQGDQQITIATEPSEAGNSNDVVVGLSKVHVDDFVTLFITEPRLEGEVTGTVRISNPFGKPFIEYDTKIDQVKMDGDSIGLVNGTGSFDVRTGIVLFKANADNKDNNFNAEGTINTRDSTGNGINISLKSEKLDLSFLNAYLGDIFSDIKGTANTQDMRLYGSGKHLSMTGTANVNEGSLIVNFTQCKYNFKNESIVFNPDEIDFGSISLKDTLNNTATLSGKMYHHFFNDVQFENIRFETSKLLVLNTTKKDNSQFYGKVIGRATMTLNGEAENMVMDISGEPSRTDSSHIYILSGNSMESGVVDYIDFVQFGTEMEQNLNGKLASKILVNMALTANPSCKIDVILDEATGDVIKGEGNGKLYIRVGNTEPLTINGRYDITKGEYTFNFQTFLKKYFTVSSGSIVWSGDPFQANIDIKAEYLAEGVDFSNLSNIATTNTGIKLKGDLIVVAHLTETLLKPSIDFEFQLPPGTPINDFLVIKRLQQFKEDKNDLNKQVTSLLLFNSFFNSGNNQSYLTAGSGYNVISSTIGGVVSNAISGFFNKLLQKYLKNLSVSIDVNSNIATDLQTNVAKLQAAAKSNLAYSFLNGRLIVSLGVNLDYNNPYANTGKNGNLLVTPDFTLEWILSKDGRLRLVGFNRTNYDLIGQRNRTGASLSFRKDFDRLSQLFSKDETRKRQQRQATDSLPSN